MKNQTAKVFLDPMRSHGEISPFLFGGFAEHMGRCIYGGIYEPGSSLADQNGLRRDVLEALRELDYTIMRYPGGNFLSGYDWLDGVGPKERRPRRRELAWQSTETNQFGTNEFIHFCREIKTAPMLGVNLGTGSIEGAANLVEYCNAPAGTKYADLRITHGFTEPHAVQYWCLGNEMDGPWQIGHLEAEEYAKKAREAAKLMKLQDPSIRLALCGSSSLHMPTFPEWDRIALETCWEMVDYLSCHLYVGNREDDTGNYLGMTALFEDQVDTLAATLRYVKGKLRSKHDVFLSWDEWNVWFKNMEMQGNWSEAPHLIEEIYNLEDALVVAEWLNVFLRRCNIIKIACVAQIVNIIAPILTTPEGLVKQTIFYPFKFFRQYAQGKALDTLVECPSYSTQKFGEMPILDVSASFDEGDESVGTAIFLVNRSLTDELPVEIIWQSQAPNRLGEVHQISSADPKAANTFADPRRIVPVRLSPVPVIEGVARINLPPMSFTVLAGS
jgi:alpha-N-arabinofuranosidase